MNMFEQHQAQMQAGSAASMDMGLRQFMLGVYNYMTGALLLTGAVAYFASSSESLMMAIFGSPLAWVVMLAPLGFILVMSFGINKLSVGAAQALFWAFSAVMGLSLSSIFLVYTGTSIVRVFFITAIIFGSMSIYGYTTKRDLTGMGHFLIVGLIGVIFASLVNLFMQSSALDFALSIIGVVIFVGLTAYDTQKLKAIYYQVAGNAEAAAKYSIMGALNLYLDFVNIFLYLLRFFGERR